MFANLVRDPFRLTKEQILDLDDFWLFYIYFHPTDKHGGVKIRQKSKGVTFSSKVQYWDDKRKWLWPDWYIQQEWDGHEAEQQAKKRERRQSKQKQPNKKVKS